MDRDLRRKLWLLIAEHEIKGKNDVTQALELLKECDLLRIEDLLPFFDDFQKIDHFKEAICAALQVRIHTFRAGNRKINSSRLAGIQCEDSGTEEGHGRVGQVGRTCAQRIANIPQSFGGHRWPAEVRRLRCLLAGEAIFRVPVRTQIPQRLLGTSNYGTFE